MVTCVASAAANLGRVEQPRRYCGATIRSVDTAAFAPFDKRQQLCGEEEIVEPNKGILQEGLGFVVLAQLGAGPHGALLVISAVSVNLSMDRLCHGR